LRAREKMNDMKSARDLLAAENQRALENLADLTRDFDSVVAASRDTNADDEHDPEGATIAFERSQIEGLIRRAEHHLEEIDGALRRLDSGTYGTCGVCGAPISERRLEARPAAQTCIVCAASTRR
jgi:DnaK suppressor protein